MAIWEGSEDSDQGSAAMRMQEYASARSKRLKIVLYDLHRLSYTAVDGSRSW